MGAPQRGAAEDLNKIHRVMAVISGKGGVGKSLVRRDEDQTCTETSKTR